MGSWPCGSSTAILWAPHRALRRGSANAVAASSSSANTRMRAGGASSPRLHRSSRPADRSLAVAFPTNTDSSSGSWAQ